jgi:hypothetical protein
MVNALTERDPTIAREALTTDRLKTTPTNTSIPKNIAMIILDNSNNLTRKLTVQLLFNKRASVFDVHLDNEKMQIEPHHITTIVETTETKKLTTHFFNRDTTKPKTMTEIIATMKKTDFHAVHLVNKIATSTTKRYSSLQPA